LSFPHYKPAADTPVNDRFKAFKPARVQVVTKIKGHRFAPVSALRCSDSRRMPANLYCS
jgi:hypothetical protein